MTVTRVLMVLLATSWLSSRPATAESLVQVNLAESRLCVPRKSVAFVLRNASPRTVDVGCSLERQNDLREWIFYQESIGTAWASKTARVWRVAPGHEERAIWPAELAQAGRFAPGRYRVIVSVNAAAPNGEPVSELSRSIGPEFALETCGR
jgi:hypothetical protein